MTHLGCDLTPVSVPKSLTLGPFNLVVRARLTRSEDQKLSSSEFRLSGSLGVVCKVEFWRTFFEGLGPLQQGLRDVVGWLDGWLLILLI